MTDLSEVLAAESRTRRHVEPNPEKAIETEKRTCDTHGEYMAYGIQLFRKVCWNRCPGCQAADVDLIEKAKAAEQAKREQARYEFALKESGIPRRFIGSTFDNYRAETEPQKRAVEVCREFAASMPRLVGSGRSLVMSGMIGTGKTHLACSVAKEAMFAGHSAEYVTCLDMIRSVRDTWRRSSETSEASVLHHFGRSLDLLVVDEIGVQYGTEGEQTILFDILDRRYNDLRPTVLISNADKDGFNAYIGDRVFSRLRETARWVSFDWDDYRPRARAAARGEA